MYSDQEICIIAYKVIIKCAALLYSGILLFYAHRGPTAEWQNSLYNSATHSMMGIRTSIHISRLNSLISILIYMWNNVSVPSSYVGRNHHSALLEVLSAERQNFIV